jgi:hypothetical protein
VFYAIFALNFSMQVPNLSRHMVFVTLSWILKREKNRVDIR